MAEKSKTKAIEPLHRIKVRSISGEIYRRSTLSGFFYLDYRLIRTYTTGTGKINSSDSFHAGNANDLFEVIKLTTEWIKAKDQTDSASRNTNEPQQ